MKLQKQSVRLQVPQLPGLEKPPTVPSLKNLHHSVVYITQVWYVHVNQTNISIAMVWRSITELVMDTVWKEKPSTGCAIYGHLLLLGGRLRMQASSAMELALDKCP
ncbi:hypothetical protein [Scytonema sp. PRP1]|uniref:hypothetical protein n=1 Tax=Scytonema sp. PRP1 TaxID=3120513 RepID=UPI002FCFF2F4